MNEQIKQQLLGYALGALEEIECADIERQLACNPAWQRELERITEQLRPLSECDEDFDPPVNLAAETCDLVSAFAEETDPEPALNDSATAPQFAQTELLTNAPLTQPAFTNASLEPAPATTAGFGKLGELVVAAGMFMAVALLFFPAISTSRQMARMAQCHNNLRQLGIAMSVYCDLSGGFYPAVPVAGNRAFAGIYGPILAEGGYLGDDGFLVCPSSNLARSETDFEIPQLTAIDEAEPQQLVELQRLAGGSYGYNIGIVQDGVYRPARNAGRSHFAVMADSPSMSLAGYTSPNHGGERLNLLYEDGSVREVAAVEPDSYWDHPFRNYFGVVEPGIHPDDAVIAPNTAPPFAHLVYGLQQR